MTRRVLYLALAALAAAGAADTHAAGKGARFEWTTKSAEAKQGLAELQQRIENFQFGPANAELAQKIVAADPAFAMGVYYLSAVTPPPDNETHLEKAVELAKRASEGERRFIEAMNVARANQGAQVKDAIPLLEKLGADYPGERLVQVILGQIYQGQNEPEKARVAFERAREIGPESARVRAFLANDDLLKGQYERARPAFLDVEKTLPKGAAPFAVRYGLAFSYLYEGQVDPAIAALKTYLAEYKDSGLGAGLPRGLHLELDRPHQPRERAARRRDAGLREGLRERPRQQPARGPEAGLVRPPAARPLPHAREDGQARAGLDRGAEDQEDDRRRRRAGEAVPPGLALPGGLPEARGGRLQGRRSRS